MTSPASLPQPFIPLNSPTAALETVGGKGANLVKLANAGFPVPNGFLIPTDTYRAFVAQNELEESIQDTLRNLDFTSPEDLAAASNAIRDLFSRGSFPSGLVAALEIGWRWLGAHPVAVRSSATAEDLPNLSFAGQQDTFLNVMGVEALGKAVIDCWSSLWTARAIGYRARNNISHAEVALSVVVQNMVSAEASGVLFTANPLNGRRTETAIDVTLGLGEALVSGQVEPDHYVVDVQNNAITHQFLGSKSVQITGKSEGGVITQEADSSQIQAIPDEAILELARIGQRIEAFYNFPQDIEWASGGDGDIHILQSRPITSLFPLPENLPLAPLKVMIGFHTVQGIMEPLTPLGNQTMQMVLTGGGQALGLDIGLDEQTAFYTAAERMWINVTPIVRHPLGHKFYPSVIRRIDPGVAEAAQKFIDDPQLAPTRDSFSRIRRRDGLRFLLRVLREVARFMRHSEKRRDQLLAELDATYAETRDRQGASGNIWADFRQHRALLNTAKNIFPDFVIPRAIPGVVAGMIPFFGILERFSNQVYAATGDERYKLLHLEIARGLPHNVTTEMDLRLWETAQILRDDASSSEVFEGQPASELAAHYLGGSLPPVAQNEITDFMAAYGMRGPGEIDLGRPRWREDPTHVMQVLQSYLQIDDPELAPDAVFERGATAAEKAGALLESEVRRLRFGWFKAGLVRFGVNRYRALAGLREAPKFFAIRMMSVIREGLLRSGRDFVNAEYLEQVDDLFFLKVRELDAIREGDDAQWAPLRKKIAKRRALRAQEMERAQIPRVLLSDGTTYYEGVAVSANDGDAIVGDPVSPGMVEGTVRVVFDPHGTQLEPGEILVCPGTDPAWTPLFLAAGGLIMEVGGMMTHGSVVAREYGIPAVVGVHQATQQLQTGDRIRLDGSTGRIEIIQD
jgi:pyruvate,water dikinase